MSRLNQILDVYQHPVNSAFISSYIPRKCGIATFTKDLTKAMNDLNPESLVRIVALNQPGKSYKYPREVVASIEREDIDRYEEVATMLNDSNVDVICLQHEYGLYGGDQGEYIFKLLGRVRQPIVTTLHTILEHPTDLQRDIIFRLARISEAVVAMIPEAKDRLEQIYGVSPDKVVVIHHGVTDRPRSVKEKKTELGLAGKKVLLMTGLINPNKGIEYVIEAMPEIVAQFPDTTFVVVGQTHPEVVEKEGEAYRERLQSLAKELNVADNVMFVNEYLPLEKLLEYYEAADIYLTPHIDLQQITSGTLAYALGMGKACISTPYIYAQEILGNEAGLLVPTHDGKAIAKAAIKILESPEYQEQLEEATYQLGRRMSWSRVAERYLILFRLIQETYGPRK